jgi:hypothetical protein
MILRATIKTTTPEKTALLFSAVLAADKGVPSRIERENGAFVVVADDGQAVRFER